MMEEIKKEFENMTPEEIREELDDIKQEKENNEMMDEIKKEFKSNSDNED